MFLFAQILIYKLALKMLLFTWGKKLSYAILLTEFTCYKINSMKQKILPQLINTPSIIKILDNNVSIHVQRNKMKILDNLDTCTFKVMGYIS